MKLTLSWQMQAQFIRELLGQSDLSANGWTLANKELGRMAEAAQLATDVLRIIEDDQIDIIMMERIKELFNNKEIAE